MGHLEPGTVAVDDRVWITNDIAGGWTQIRGRVTEVTDTGVQVDISPYLCGSTSVGWFAFKHVFATNDDARPEEFDLRTEHEAAEWEQTQEAWWAEGKGPGDVFGYYSDRPR